MSSANDKVGPGRIRTIHDVSPSDDEGKPKSPVIEHRTIEIKKSKDDSSRQRSNHGSDSHKSYRDENRNSKSSHGRSSHSSHSSHSSSRYKKRSRSRSPVRDTDMHKVLLSLGNVNSHLDKINERMDKLELESKSSVKRRRITDTSDEEEISESDWLDEEDFCGKSAYSDFSAVKAFAKPPASAAAGSAKDLDQSAGASGFPTISSFWKDVSNDIEEDDKVGEPLNEDIRAFFNKRMRATLSAEGLKKYTDNYPRPSNMEFLKTHEINPKIRDALPRPVREDDDKLKRFESLFMKIMIAIARVSEDLKKREGLGDWIKESMKKLAEIFGMASFFIRFKLVKERREAFRHLLPQEYKCLANDANPPGATYLLTDNLETSLKEGEHVSKLAKRMEDIRKSSWSKQDKTKAKTGQGKQAFKGKQGFKKPFNKGKKGPAKTQGEKPKNSGFPKRDPPKE